MQPRFPVARRMMVTMASNPRASRVENSPTPLLLSSMGAGMGVGTGVGLPLETQVSSGEPDKGQPLLPPESLPGEGAAGPMNGQAAGPEDGSTAHSVAPI